MEKLSQKYIDSVDCPHGPAIEIIENLQRAYWKASNAAAGLTNHCNENGSTRQCEKELDEARQLYRAIWQHTFTME